MYSVGPSLKLTAFRRGAVELATSVCVIVTLRLLTSIDLRGCCWLSDEVLERNGDDGAASKDGIDSDTSSCTRKVGLGIFVDVLSGEDVRDCEDGLAAEV